MEKKGVSIIIGYVLLVVFALIIGTMVYNVLKTYIPKDVPECPEGVSIFVKDLTYTEDYLNITIMNTGLFDIAGYFIHATNSSSQEIATKDLSEFLKQTNARIVNGVVIFLGEDNPMKPNDKQSQIFELDGEIYSIEIIPVRFQEEDNKKRFLSCGNSKIQEKVSLMCAPVCGTKVCGPDPVCGIECSPCTGTDVCNGAGECVLPAACTDTCASLGYGCGTHTICGNSTNCGDCLSNEVCSAIWQCEIACGNGEINTGETCDDGGVVNGDGCSSICTIETGWTCSGEPSACFYCNDNYICDSNENCQCSDCFNKQNGCDEGWMCQDGSCVQGIPTDFGCADYCIYLGIYSGGNCRQNPSQCTVNKEVPVGELYCSTGVTPQCCCIPQS